MNDDRLNRLKNRPVPPPSKKAKMAALEAAMAAFDAAGESMAQEKAELERAATQGSAASERPKTGFIANAWSWFMDTPLLSRPVMATLIILPVAGFVALQYLRDHPQPVAVQEPIEPALQTGRSEGANLRAANERPAAKPEADGEAAVSVDSLADAAAPAPVAQADEERFRRAQSHSADEIAMAKRTLEERLEAEPEQKVMPQAREDVPPGDVDFSGGERARAASSEEVANSQTTAPPAARQQGLSGDDQRLIDSFYRGGETVRGFESSGIGPRGNTATRNAPTDGNAAPQAGAGFDKDQFFVYGGGSRMDEGNGVGIAPDRRQEQRVGRLVRPMPPRERDVAVQEKLENRDQFEVFDDNAAKIVADEPVTTFSVDVDTASYAFVRRSLESGRMPPHDAVRVEEMINYFSYAYPAPEDAKEPFRASVALYPTPWNPETRLMHIGIKGYDVAPDVRPASNLVFLIDVSGSMDQPDKLPLLKNAFRMLVGELGEDDTVSIVTYAGAAGVVLEPTSAKEKRRILAAIDNLRPGGSTAGAAGIEQAYALADEAFRQDGVNRVILATDGDFNVGISDPDELKRFIEKKRRSGTFLSVLGFGQGNYNDALMQSLAQNGNGVAAYIDSLNEAQKVLVEEASANLFPIAKDVKIQIEFNPARVSEYRLIGYETRALRNQDFANDKVDAGDIGSGHTVTAIYELTLAGSATSQLDERRYAQPADAVTAESAHSGEFAFLKLRYKLPDEDQSRLVTLPVTDALAADGMDGLSDDVRFAAAVAAFGQKLRGNHQLDDYSYDEIAELASSARGSDPFGYRGAFLSLVRLAGSLDR